MKTEAGGFFLGFSGITNLGDVTEIANTTISGLFYAHITAGALA